VQKSFAITKFLVILALAQQTADLAIADEQRRARRLLKRKAGPLPRRRALAVRPAVPVGKDCTFSSG
jgi:hypothetical protein